MLCPLFFCTISYSQSFNLDQVGKAKLMNVSGGIATNSVFYEGTGNRQPLTYFIRGNLNINISSLYNIPLSFTYSNQKFNFPTPFRFNRLSLHPSYKWVTAHIGDVTMTFSPYTLNGHQFTGAGVDLTPNGPFTISAMYGRFLKATEYNEENPEAAPAYNRMGYGFKTAYDFKKIKTAFIFFTAKDDENSIQNGFPANVNTAPKHNAVISAETTFKLFDKAQFTIEYAATAITEDTRASANTGKKGLLSFLVDENSSTAYYNALKAQMDYPAGNGSLGVGYERIDPNYRTLGAYFFNNDLENITVNASQNLFDSKLSVAVNAGLQRDNLENTKTAELQRIVSAINLNYAHSEKLTLNGSYSNFQSYTNIRNQFDYINEVTDFDNVDTLNYRQISQNANVGVTYVLKKEEDKQNSINLNLALQDAKNQQEGNTLDDTSSIFYNAAAAYTLGYPQKALNISVAVNATQNNVATANSFTFGPTLVINKQFLDKKLRTNFSSSYNTSFTNGNQQNNIYNFRVGGSYTLLEKHNFNLNLLSLFRNTTTSNANDFTATFGYTYTFSEIKFNFKKKDKRAKDNSDTPDSYQNANQVTLKLRYRKKIYEGTLPQVTQQLYAITESSTFSALPFAKQEELQLLLKIVEEQTEANPYKDKAVDFLDAFYEYDDFLIVYNEAINQVIQKIKHDMKRVDFRLEKRYTETKNNLINYQKQQDTVNASTFTKTHTQLEEAKDEALKKVLGHRWMEKQFKNYTKLSVIKKPDELLHTFKQKELENALNLHKKQVSTQEIAAYLENQIIQFYYTQSLAVQNPKDFKPKYFKN